MSTWPVWLVVVAVLFVVCFTIAVVGAIWDEIRDYRARKIERRAYHANLMQRWEREALDLANSGNNLAVIEALWDLPSAVKR